MWYLTSYSIEAKQEIIDDLIKNNENAEYAFDTDGSTYESLKWYWHDKDLLEFSKKYPNDLITLSWEWEESWDIWKTYYKNWKLQHEEAKIIIDSFDENKLIEPT